MPPPPPPRQRPAGGGVTGGGTKGRGGAGRRGLTGRRPSPWQRARGGALKGPRCLPAPPRGGELKGAASPSSRRGGGVCVYGGARPRVGPRVITPQRQDQRQPCPAPPRGGCLPPPPGIGGAPHSPARLPALPHALAGGGVLLGIAYAVRTPLHTSAELWPPPPPPPMLALLALPYRHRALSPMGALPA